VELEQRHHDVTILVAHESGMGLITFDPS